MSLFRRSCAVSLLLALVSPALAHADSLLRDRITVDATAADVVTVNHTLSWTAGVDGRPRTSLQFHLARGVDVVSATSEGATLTANSKDLAGSDLRVWTLNLTVPIPLGDSRDVEVVTSIREAGVSGIRIDGAGGVLLPGSGWCPQVSLESDELIEHRTLFRLPDGRIGVAAGTGTGPLYGADVPARPFAVWGNWTRSEFDDDGVSFVAYRAAGATGPLPGAENFVRLIHALELGAGPALGSAPWTFIDVGNGTLAGGQKTIFWDETVAAAGGPLRERDLAGALAVSVWTEAMRFTGPLSNLFSRAFPLYLGDAAAITLDVTDARWQTEQRIIGARREQFIRELAQDQALMGLLSSNPEAPRSTETRGALVVHMTANACPSTSYFMDFLRTFREAYDGTTVDDTVFGAELSRRFAKQHAHLKPYLETTDLADFVISDHGHTGKEGAKRRYRVEVENKGAAAGYADVSTFTVDGVLLRSSRQLIKPGEKRAVLFGDAQRIAKIAVDPGARHLQSEVAGEVVELNVTADSNDTPYIPSFRFSSAGHDFHWLDGFSLELEGVSIRDFRGQVMSFETHHGPTGMLMFGSGKVVVQPGGNHGESFYDAMGREQMEFQTTALWVRFPLGSWASIQGAFQEPPAGVTEPSERQVRFMYEHSFPTYFHDSGQAQVPPPGSALVVFSLGGVERRGYVRVPAADGTVYERLWDQLRGSTLWEATY